MAAVAWILCCFFFGITISSKVVSQDVPGALLTEAHPLHIRRHQLVLGGEILGVEELVDLNHPSHTILHPSPSSAPTLDQCSELVVWPQEDHKVNLR